MRRSNRSNGCLSTPRVSHARRRPIPSLFTCSCENLLLPSFDTFLTDCPPPPVHSSSKSSENFFDDLKLCPSKERESYDLLVFPKKLRNATEGGEGKLINTSSGWSFVSSGEGKMGKFMHFPPLPCHNNIFEITGAPHSCAMIPP